jgi:rhamnosyl/mannosyltransferase
VINTAVPHSGVSWVSRDGETGLTIPVGDAAALAAAARRLLEEPGLRDRLAAGAIERTKREFDAEVMAKRSFELYAQAMGTRSSRAPGAARRASATHAPASVAGEP